MSINQNEVPPDFRVGHGEEFGRSSVLKERQYIAEGMPPLKATRKIAVLRKLLFDTRIHAFNLQRQMDLDRQSFAAGLPIVV